MAGYVRRIALIKTLKSGYSSDGGGLKGIVRCEAYAGLLRVEASMINFAPLDEGEYRIGISDGQRVAIFSPPVYEEECDFDPSEGFACLICYCRAGAVMPVACAVCGDCQGRLAAVQSAIESEEQPPKTAYNDEAIADENYYELETDKNGGAVRPPQKQEEGRADDQDEEGARAVPLAPGEESTIRYSASPFRIGGSPEREEDICAADDGKTDGGQSNGAAHGAASPRAAEDVSRAAGGEEYGADAPARPELAGGGFYERMSDDVKKIFSTYPHLSALEQTIEGSRWAKISYGSGFYYAFGVIYSGGNAKYLCYAVPVPEGAPCPESLKGRAGYIPVKGVGYWVMYQDAQTGVSISVEQS